MHGTIAAMGERTRGYAHRIDVAADAPLVWSALTSTQSLSIWCSPRAQIDARAGGSFRAAVDRVTELEAHIDQFVPERRIRLIYLPCAALPPAASAIVDDFMLDPTESGTIVRLLGSGVPAEPEWDPIFVRLRLGWERAMARLKVLVERSARGAARS